MQQLIMDLAFTDAEYSLIRTECLSSTILWFSMTTFLVYGLASVLFKKQGRIPSERILGSILAVIFVIVFTRTAQRIGASFFAFYYFYLDIGYPFGRPPFWPIIPSIIIGGALGFFMVRKKKIKNSQS